MDAEHVSGVPSSLWSPPLDESKAMLTHLKSLILIYILKKNTTHRLSRPVFRSLKRGVPPSTLPPSGTSSSSITPADGAGTCTDVWNHKTDVAQSFHRFSSISVLFHTLSVSISHTTSSSVTESPTALKELINHHLKCTQLPRTTKLCLCWQTPTFLPPHIPFCNRLCKCRGLDCDHFIPCKRISKIKKYVQQMQYKCTEKAKFRFTRY